MGIIMDAIKNGSIEKTPFTRKLTIAGETKAYPVYRVPLADLYYNDKNDRITTWIEEYKSEHGGQGVSRADLEQYNLWIEQFIVASNPDRLAQTKMNIRAIGQQVAGIILADGRIVDGNRRYTCLRQLSREQGGAFDTFETVVLEKDFASDAKQIKMLELMVQLGAEERVDYQPIERLAGLYNTVEREKELTLEEYAQSVNQPVRTVQTQLGIAKLMEEYLEFIRVPYQFHVARKQKLSGPLEECYKTLMKEKDETRRLEWKKAMFSYLALVSVGDTTRKLRRYEDVLKDKHEGQKFLEQQLAVASDLSSRLQHVLDGAEREAGQPLTAAQATTTVTQFLDTLRDDSPLAKKAAREAEEADERMRLMRSREQAASVLEKATNAIAAIDQGIFPHLSSEQRQTIREDIDALMQMLAEMKESARA